MFAGCESVFWHRLKLVRCPSNKMSTSYLILGDLRQKLHFRIRPLRSFSGHPLQLRGWFHPVHTFDLAGIGRKIQTRANTYFQHPATCLRNPSATQMRCILFFMAALMICGKIRLA
jgi:hypothetical protein